MKRYWKNLKEHPGVGMASFMTVMCFLAAGTNKNIDSVKGVMLLGFIGSAFFWSIVLITNFKR